MAVKFTQGFIDHSGEQSSTQFYIQEAAGDDFTTAIATAATVETALAIVTLCNLTNRTLSLLVDTEVPVIPTDEFAQRESALRIDLVDNVTGARSSMQIPGPDLAALAQANTDEVDIVSNVVAAALVGTLEASLASSAGNTVSVTRMRIVGRAS
jgi:hypothetical protein